MPTLGFRNRFGDNRAVNRKRTPVRSPKRGHSPRPTRAPIRDSGVNTADLVVGRRAVAELIEHAAHDVREVWLQGRRSAWPHLGAAQVIPNLRIHEEIDRERLTDLAGTDSHQGVVVRRTPRRVWQLDEWLTTQESDAPCLVVVLDGIQDPMNLGAILRASDCFGASAVLWSWNRGASLTPAVVKTSVGATELMTLIQVANVRNALSLLKEAGFWSVGAALGPNATALGNYRFSPRTALVLGSEGEGIQPLILKEIDEVVMIPMHGRVESLNVSQASAVFLSAWAGQHLGPGGG
jgi:23S rRNA (guanosine2251-2'-O)-methyltransferase